MFFDKSDNPKRRGALSGDSAVTILTPGCHFSGKLYCKGSSRIGGRIEGELVSEGFLIIEEEAVIQANVKADEAIIQGKVKGCLEAKVRVELAETAHFEGDLITPSLVVNEGARFDGRASMRPKEDKLDVRLPAGVEDLRKKTVLKNMDINPLPEVSVTQ